MQMALAKQLSKCISEADIQRNWPKMKIPSSKKKALAVTAAVGGLNTAQQDDVNKATALQIVMEATEETGEEYDVEPAPVLRLVTCEDLDSRDTADSDDTEGYSQEELDHLWANLPDWCKL
jgi:hypothetical protein